MLRMASVLVLLLVGADLAMAQTRYAPPAPPPPVRSRGWFFDLFAPPRQPPPQVVIPSSPSVPRTPRASGPAAPRPSNAPSTDSGRTLPLTGAIPPYEADLLRLAEIVGALHYLRPLCKTAEGARWRAEMQALIEVEAQSEDRKEKLTRSFNRGYFAYERTYRSCTPAATVATERYLAEGTRLAHEIVARYSN